MPLGAKAAAAAEPVVIVQASGFHLVSFLLQNFPIDGKILASNNLRLLLAIFGCNLGTGVFTRWKRFARNKRIFTH